jgi:hypothetical protein
MAELNLKQWLRDNIKPYLSEIKASIGSVTGAYRGSFTTVAGMPSSAKAGDWAILSVDDSINESGIWVKSATVWQYVQDLQSFTEIIENIVASNAEYTTGTSTTKAPSVAQVKGDVQNLQNQITSISNNNQHAVESHASLATGWETDINNLDDTNLGIDVTVPLNKITEVGFVRKVATLLLTKIKAINTALSTKAAIGGSSTQSFLVANANSLTNEAVNANQFNFTINSTEAAADYASA